MSDLQLKAWHIENLIEAEPDAQVVLLAEAQDAIRKVEQERDRLRNGLIQVSAWLESDTDAVARDYCINANHIYESTAHAQEIILTALDGEESKS